ncbi:hypothetical protein B0T26DRAFT_708021, partial [Lasiosphaeria miniovina]
MGNNCSDCSGNGPGRLPACLPACLPVCMYKEFTRQANVVFLTFSLNPIRVDSLGSVGQRNATAGPRLVQLGALVGLR